jgi:tRNA (guanine37-N1)-methyltransferase
MHKEHGVSMKVDLGKVYFSPRASAERLRIASLIKKNENVLVMFGGIGVFSLIIAKVQPHCRVWSVDINPEANKLAEENIRLNRMGDRVIAMKGDVREVAPRIGEHFDRIVMPFPEKDWDYLDLALKYAAPNAMIHFVVFVHELELDKAKTGIREIAKGIGRRVQIKNWHLMGSYAPRVNRYTFDIQVR